MTRNNWRTGNEREWAANQARLVEEIFTKEREKKKERLRKLVKKLRRGDKHE